MAEQSKMPESLRDSWFGQDNTVAKTRPSIVRLDGGLVSGQPGKLYHRAWFEMSGRMFQASVIAGQGEDWKFDLAGALENVYQKAVGGES